MARALFLGDVPEDGSFQPRRQPCWQKTETRHSLKYYLPRLSWQAIFHPLSTITEIIDKIQRARHPANYAVWKCNGCHFKHELPMTSQTRPRHCMLADDGK